MKKFRTILNCIFAFTLIFMLIAIVGMNENSNYVKDNYSEDLSDGWMLSQPDGTRSEMTLPYDYSDGNPNIRIIRTLPDVTDYSIIQIMCNYRSMTAYIDGEEIFHALPSTFGLIKTDMGHYVALIPLDAKHSGKEIEIHITERESGYRSEVREIRLTSTSQFGFQILEENALHLLFSCILLVSAVILLIAWFAIWIKNGVIPEETYHSLLWISLFSAALGFWFFTEAYVWAISTGAFAASGTMSYLALSLMPLSLLGILKSICLERLNSLRWIVIVAKVVLIAEWIFFLTGIFDFSDMLTAMHIECVVAVSIFAIFLIWKRKLFLVGDAIRYGIWVLLFMLLVTLITYFYGGNWLLCGLLTALVVLSSVTIAAIMRINQALKDIAQTKQYKEYALTDIMTGLKSRYAYSIFETQQKMGALSNDLHLIFLDIDMLKKVNDTLGHVAGDEMIVAASKCIKDAFGDVAECFRMGGDEFLVALVTTPDVVSERIAHFNQLVSRWHGRYVNCLTVSYGVVSASEYPGLNFEALLKTADDMMYQHKRQQTDRN